MNDRCKHCDKPIHWVDHEQSWYHDDLLDMWNCPVPMVTPAEPAGV